MRSIVNTLGYAGWDMSRNYWSIYLILTGETASVCLNISWSKKRILTASTHACTVTNSHHALSCLARDLQTHLLVLEKTVEVLTGK